MVKKLIEKILNISKKKKSKITFLSKVNLEKIKNKTIILRTDYNVPIQKTKSKTNPYVILDNTKIKASFKTIEFLIKQGCKVVIITHLKQKQTDPLYQSSLKPIKKELETLIKNTKISTKKIHFIKDCIGPKTKIEILKKEKPAIILCENLRHYKEEKENDDAFAHSLSELGDIYINESFATAHRDHASLTKITKFLPSFAGFHFESELKHIQRGLNKKTKNVWVLSGAKLDKVDIVKSAINNAQVVLIAGALAFPFLKAKGCKIGHSLATIESVKKAKSILNMKGAKQKIILPIDVKIAKSLQETKKKNIHTVPIEEIPASAIALDIGPKTIELFSYYIDQAKNIVINGPLGYMENKEFQTGTKRVYKKIAFLSKNHKCFSIAGGGETTQIIHKLKLHKQISHVSTAGGAMSTFLSQKPMPAIISLQENTKKFKN